MIEKHIELEEHGRVGFKSHAQMVLWNVSDYYKVKSYYERCQRLSKEVQFWSAKARNEYLSGGDKDILKQLQSNADYYSNELNKLIDELESKTYNYKYSDKKNGFELGNRKVEPRKIAIIENTLVNPALVIYAKQISNTAIEEFRYIASGTGSLPTTPNQNKLQSENSRLDIFINGGFRNPHGDVIREGVIFPPGLDDALVTEFGSFTMPTADEGDMQWRNVIDNVAEQIDHDQGNTFYSIAHVTILQINYIND